MKTLLTLLTIFLLTLVASNEVQAQDFFNNDRIRAVTNTHDVTVNNITQDAINALLVGGNVVSWKICNDGENTSTHLLVGQAADVSDDGTMLLKGGCFECLNCKSSVLKLMRVESQANDNGYSVIQYRK